ncbi:hypothetical protein TPHA_0C04900 [Tetrapisispora phaffii CBS 4417]|uniref:Uncharacterized protein n=1 Tax=Tetrapisispora phaffii (strain ATCC 24235 / CBS 4417 / NBRC 1672 / NRRL Y-8282 / UCD 70-5) TaxID=1071381 RepID=G8BQX6_TETPH|nr:hypothetical protein TPHA_0C04900 [Tetrapisispora phaffii CBS 4417]CCE62638.1 hypothetical protein TPHA_0C04900 [Tetrapisispora phaffii CBS 4417]
MAKYAWYTRASDTIHRLTVLGLVGGSVYMVGGLGYTMYINGKNYEKQVTATKLDQNEARELEGSVTSAE